MVLTQAGLEIQSAELTQLPTSTVPVSDESTARKVLQFMEALEGHDDVNHAYANFDIPDKILMAVSK